MNHAIITIDDSISSFLTVFVNGLCCQSKGVGSDVNLPVIPLGQKAIINCVNANNSSSPTIIRIRSWAWHSPMFLFLPSPFIL